MIYNMIKYVLAKSQATMHTYFYMRLSHNEDRDRVRLLRGPFDKFTSIIGPNGSGKSNVMERWLPRRRFLEDP